MQVLKCSNAKDEAIDLFSCKNVLFVKIHWEPLSPRKIAFTKVLVSFTHIIQFYVLYISEFDKNKQKFLISSIFHFPFQIHLYSRLVCMKTFQMQSKPFVATFMDLPIHQSTSLSSPVLIYMVLWSISVSNSLLDQENVTKNWRLRK